MGTCLPVYGKKQGETCYRDTDCESGFLCLESICQTPMPGDKGLGKKKMFDFTMGTILGKGFAQAQVHTVNSTSEIFNHRFSP